MDEKDWLILRTLQEKKSITKTASTVFISQPALSKRLQQIEERFGVTLAVRSKTGIELTPEGSYLASSACELLEKIRSMDESIRGMRDELQGTLRIQKGLLRFRQFTEEAAHGLHKAVSPHPQPGPLFFFQVFKFFLIKAFPFHQGIQRHSSTLVHPQVKTLGHRHFVHLLEQ